MDSSAQKPATSENLDRVKMVVYTRSLVQPPVMAALVKQLESQKGKLEFEVLKDPGLIRASIEKTNLTVLILTLNAKEELVDVLNVLTQVESRIQSGLLRALVLNGMNHPRVVALLKSKGVSEIIDFQINIKALNHKIKNALLVVTQTHQRMSNQKMRASTMLGADNAQKSNRGGEQGGNEITWDKPTEHPCDYWWLPSNRNIRHVMGRWLIDMLGPGPAAGYWEETTYDRSGEKGWQWKIRISTDPTFQPQAGRWLFFGKQPEFVWQKNLWSFVSKHPYFAFYAEGEKDPELTRFETVAGGKLRAHENSQTSQGYLPKIQASLEASLKLSKSEAGGGFDVDHGGGGSGGAPNLSADDGGGGGNFSYGAGGGGGSGGEPAFRQGDLSPDAPAGDWNNHGSAVGFGFKAKDIRVNTDGPRAKWRNALTPDEMMGNLLGLAEVRQVGVVSGAKTFEKMVLNLRVRTRNGQEAKGLNPLRAIELTANRGVFEMSTSTVKSGDRLILEVEFRLGDVEKKLELEWTCEGVQPVVETGALVQGVFTGGNLTDWTEILRLAEQRFVELRDFFSVAKGA